MATSCDSVTHCNSVVLEFALRKKKQVTEKLKNINQIRNSGGEAISCRLGNRSGCVGLCVGGTHLPRDFNVGLIVAPLSGGRSGIRWPFV